MEEVEARFPSHAQLFQRSKDRSGIEATQRAALRLRADKAPVASRIVAQDDAAALGSPDPDQALDKALSAQRLPEEVGRAVTLDTNAGDKLRLCAMTVAEAVKVTASVGCRAPADELDALSDRVLASDRGPGKPVALHIDKRVADECAACEAHLGVKFAKTTRLGQTRHSSTEFGPKG